MVVRARWALAGAAACVVLLMLTWFAAFHIGAVRSADRAIFSGFYELSGHGWIDRLAYHLASLCDPTPYVYFVPIPIIIALARGRPRVAVAVAVILLGANVTTHVLKPLLQEPREASFFGWMAPIYGASWPSGHATAAMSLALSTVIAVPPRIRPAVAALGALFAVAVSYSFLTLGWHFPSDVFGGFLVAGAWTLVVVAGLLAIEGRNPYAQRKIDPVSFARTLGPVGAALAAGTFLATIALVTRPHAVVAYADAHKTFVVGALAIAALGFVISTVLVLTLTPSDTGPAPTAAHRRRWRPG
jgi:membrane-associated phospholipid phosphatase